MMYPSYVKKGDEADEGIYKYMCRVQRGFRTMDGLSNIKINVVLHTI